MARQIVFTPAAGKPPSTYSQAGPAAGGEWLRRFSLGPPGRRAAKLPARIPGLRVSVPAIAEA